MKRITFLITAILMTSQLHTSAQFISGFGIKGGITYGYQIHEYNSNFSLDRKNILGINGSIFGEFLNNRFINLYAETGYDQRGFLYPTIRTNEFGNEIGEGELKYRTNYIFFTLGTKQKLTGKYITPYILFQPRINFYLGYTEIFPDGMQEYNNYVLEDYKKITFDLGIGAGIELNRLLPYRISLEANYFPELITSYSGPEVNVKEHSFNFKLGINFIKDKKKK